MSGSSKSFSSVSESSSSSDLSSEVDSDSLSFSEVVSDDSKLWSLSELFGSSESESEESSL